MKKILFLIPVLLLTTSAHATDFCVKKITYAVGEKGECQKFVNTCSVPENWKVVPACDIVKSVDTGSRPEDVIERRRQQRAAAYTTRRAAQPAVSTSRRMNYSGRKIGAAALTRNRATREKADLKVLANRSKTRTSTYRHGASSAYIKLLNKYRNPDASAKTVGRTRGSISSVDQSRREGKLSNEPKWSVNTHFRARAEDSSIWKKSLERRNYLTSGRRIKRKRTPRTVKLRTYYRGGTTLREKRINAEIDSVQD